MPLPRVDEILDSLAGCHYFSTLDLSSGYLQIPIAQEDIPKTAFATHRGLFQYRKMSFGLCNGPATCQRLMGLVLNGMIGKHTMVYMDDIVCFSRTFEDHLEHLRGVFLRLQAAGLKLKPSKCTIASGSVTFLGHVVSKQGIQVDPVKVESIRSWPTPTTVSEVKAFIGTANYYRKFIRNFADIAAPLNKLQGKTEFKWSTECEEAFCALKHKLMSAPILNFPDFSEDAVFILDTDASQQGIGSVLSLKLNG